jgi:hypothetical protein
MEPEGESEEEEAVSDFMCVVCQGDILHPHTWPCGHSYCAACSAGCLQAGAATPHPDGGLIVTAVCPHCRMTTPLHVLDGVPLATAGYTCTGCKITFRLAGTMTLPCPTCRQQCNVATVERLGVSVMLQAAQVMNAVSKNWL